MPDLKVEGLVKDWCAACAHCAGKKRLDGHTYYICEDPYDGVTTESDAEDNILCNMFKVKENCSEGSYPFGNDADDVIKYSANDVVIIAKAMAEKEYGEKQKKLEDKVSAYEKILIDILNEAYEHPEMFERNMTAYELLPGRVKFLKDSWDMMCDKYDPLNVENEQRKKAMDNQAKMIQDLKKERDKLAEKNKLLEKRNDNQFVIIGEKNKEIEKLKNVDISKVPKLESRIKNLEYLNEESYKREEKLEKELNKVKAHDEALTKHFQNDEKLIDNIQKVIFPQEEGSDYTYSYDEILNKVKGLKVQCDEIDKIKNENISLNTINKGLAEDRKKLINYMRSLKIASENYLKEFTYGED